MSNLLDKYKCRIALFENDEKWLKSSARAVKLNNFYDVDRAIDLSRIMEYFLDTTFCIGISSSNIFWSRTKSPLRMIHVPHPVGERYITLVNPEIKEKSEKTFESLEGCAAFPNEGFKVRRSCYVFLAGMMIKNCDFKPVELEYGVNGRVSSSNKDERLENSWIVQHELDHLDGILLSDKAYSRFDLTD